MWKVPEIPENGDWKSETGRGELSSKLDVRR